MFSLRTQSILCVTCCVLGTCNHFPAPVESAATLGARQGSPGTRPVRAPRTSPTAAMSTARSSLEVMRLFSLAPAFFAVRAGCRLLHFVLGRSGIDSLPGTLPRLRRGTLPAKSQEPALRGKARLRCALIRTARYSSAEVCCIAQSLHSAHLFRGRAERRDSGLRLCLRPLTRPIRYRGAALRDGLCRA